MMTQQRPSTLHSSALKREGQHLLHQRLSSRLMQAFWGNALDQLLPQVKQILESLLKAPRRTRRAYRKRFSSSLAGAAISLALLSPSPLQSATITVVSGGCTLIDAIDSANTNNSYNGCTAGDPGADTIIINSLPTSYSTPTDNNSSPTSNSEVYGRTLFPIITTEITIIGNGSSVTRDPSGSKFRFFGVESTGILTIDELNLYNGYAEKDNSNDIGNGHQNGGAILVRSGGYLSIKNSVLDNNTAELGDGGEGGAIYFEGDNSPGLDLKIDNCTITNNSAHKGTGVKVSGDADFYISGSNISYNYANGADGIGAYFDSSIGIIKNSIISNNHSDPTAAVNGGGIFIKYSDNLTLDNVTISGHSDPDNGEGVAVFIYGSSVTINNSLIDNNTAYYYSAVYATERSNLSVNNSVFSGNSCAPRCEDGGGAVTLNKGSISVRNSRFTGNYADADAGALFASSPDNVSIENSLFTSNVSASNGGALYIDSASYIRIKDSSFEGNSADNSSSGHGGGAYLASVTGDVIIDNVSFKNNNAYHGGGLALKESRSSTGGTNFTINSSLFDNNTATDKGAGIYAYIDGSYDDNLTINGSIFSRNNASDGAGINIEGHDDTVTVEKSLIKNNIISGNGEGAGIRARDVYLSIVNSTISGNEISGDGPGSAVYLDSGSLETNHSTVVGNRINGASSEGAIYVTSASFYISNSIVSGNHVQNSSYASEIW